MAKQGNNLVVILGAGASADFGVPTLRGVFKDLYARRYLARDQWLKGHLDDTFWGPRGQSLETSDESLTIEEMLTILRDWRQESTIPHGLSPEEQERFRRSLCVLIECALFEGKSTNREHLNPLINFADTHFAHVTWASFNWDCVFESSFWYASGPPIPLGMRRNPSVAVRLADWRTGTHRHLFLKLHGGINWWMRDGVLTYIPFAAGGPLTGMWRDFGTGVNPGSQPVILEPSYYKYSDESYKILEPQWAEFLKRLIAAHCVLIVGYSLPEGDVQARSKILTAFQANPTCEWGVVDPSQDVCARYRRLLGTRRVKVFPTTLAGFNNSLDPSLRSAFGCIPPIEEKTPSQDAKDTATPDAS